LGDVLQVAKLRQTAEDEPDGGGVPDGICSVLSPSVSGFGEWLKHGEVVMPDPPPSTMRDSRDGSGVRSVLVPVRVLARDRPEVIDERLEGLG
jgi:hypothetical protein